MAAPSIIADRLSKRFGGFVAVDSVSFEVRPGEIFGFLGANGAGKSTTIKMLCGLLSSSSGTARVGGYDINRQADLVKKNIGYMSQKFSLYEDLTVAENINFFGGVYGLDGQNLKNRRQWALEMAGLSERQRSLTRELAGGLKQRLALGCAILHQPGIIFLDEPTGGVDPVSRRSFWDLINELSSGGTTIFVTTHYLDEAEYCNQITLMHAGRIVAGGSPNQLKKEWIKNPILEFRSDDVVKAMGMIQGLPWALETTIFGNSLHVSVKDVQSGKREIIKALGTGNVKPENIREVSPTLEDVFITLIEKKTPIENPEGK
ncbi:MAG: ABC transporter ATP-binding protein [Candidatus Edwardsbacteria bacterium]|nr:ABC transporter ATP-binding protein [Candidatus Edwardsbacteria bacterium]